MKIFNKTYLKEKISKLNIYAIISFLLPVLVFGPSLLKKNPEKEQIFIRPRAELRSVDAEGNFYTYSYPVIDSKVGNLILKNEPPRYQNLEEIIAEYYPQSVPYISMIKNSIEEHKNIFHLDSLLVPILINAESGGNPDAVSVAGAAGLMQLMPETAEKMGLKVYETDIYGKLKEARRNMIKAYSSALRAMRQENYERLIERSKEYNFYVNETDLLFQEYKRTLLENKDLDERLNPEKNIWAGVKYLAILAKLNMEDESIASVRSIIAAYNFKGEDAAREWTLPTIDEPINHANIVVEAYIGLKRLAIKSPVVYVE